jgi:uncharacterized protein (TIGR03437 family)
MKHAVVILSLASALVGGTSGQPVVSTVLNTASFSAAVSPGSWVSIFGANFANATMNAQSVPLPTSLGGVTVKVGSLPALIRYVSPRQIDALIPLEATIPANTVVSLTITSSDGSSAYDVRLSRNAPGIFTQVTDEGISPSCSTRISTRSTSFGRRMP